MSQNNKLTISNHEIDRIVDFAMSKFHESHNCSNLDVKQLQAYLIVNGVFDLLKSMGVEPQFEIKVKVTK